MEFRILGPLEVYDAGKQVSVERAKLRALLAILLLEANRVVAGDRLIDALWDEEPPETARKAVQVYVSQLRKLLGADVLVTRSPGYLLRVEPGMLDLERFEALRREARDASPEVAADKLREALALFRGRPLADLADERFAQGEIARLEELRLAALEDRIDAELRLGLHAELAGELEALVAENPARERLCGQRMLALYRCGRQAAALEAYQAARHALVEELGIEPSKELRELHQAILRQDPALDLEAGPVTEAASDERSPFVGRVSELAELTAGLKDAFAGHGRLFLLQGEPGIGKSRLADELLRLATARRATVLAGRCWEAGGAPAYWPWTQSLRAYVRRADPGVVRRQLGSGASDVAQILPELRELFEGLAEPESTSFEAARFRLFDSTASFLRNAAGEQPLVLVLDDLHAADDASLLLLRYVASVLGDSRILIVGTFRDLDPAVQAPLEATLAELSREPVTRRIRLVGLSESEVARLAEATAQTAPPEQLVTELHTETDGNPLFVSEIVRLLAAEGRLEVETPGGIPIPETIREAIGRRLSRLSGECRQVLSLGSVFGREFGLVALERVADYSGIDTLLSVLDEALAARVVEEIPGVAGRLRFGHALTRDTLYSEIPATQRARLHRRAAEVLEALYQGSPDAHLAELAHHFSMAIPAAAPETAREYARRAAVQAERMLAYEDAVRLYRLALEALEREGAGDESTRCELLLALGDAETAAGEGAASRDTFFRAAEIARMLDAPELFARAALGYSGRFAWSTPSGDTQLVPLLEEAVARGTDDPAVRARLLARLACALGDEPVPERIDALSREAVDIARALGDPATLVYTLMGRRLAAWSPDNVAELVQITSEIVQLADDSGEPERAADARLLRIEGHLLHGDMRGVRVDLDDAARLAVEARRPTARWHVEVHQAELALLEGRFEDAEQHIARTVDLGERALVSDVIGSAATQTFAVRRAVGGLDESADDLARLAEERPSRPLFRCLLAVIDIELGDRKRAQRTVSELSADEFAAVPRGTDWLLAIAMLIEVAVALADVEHAAVLYRLLEPYADLVVVDPHGFHTGSAARSLGMAAWTCGRFDEAEGHFLAALELNERIGARPWLADTQSAYAQMLLARNEPGDAERARELVESALGTYRELGMEPYAARTSVLAREAAAVSTS
jgi:DNA-binding SARP family transcriptional activator/tetratricopeptide (TPR) repeat protein